MSRTDLLPNAIENGEEVQTNGVRVSASKPRTVFGDGSTVRREWGERDWAEESRFTEYAADGSRLEYVVTESPDCGTATNSVSTYDLLGRMVAQSVPGGNGTRIETRSFYDDVSDRLLRTETDGSPDATYGYDSRLLCTNEAVTLGADHVDVARAYDNRSRCDFVAVEVTNASHAVKTRRFDA